ncbi:solute carrier family 52, riboflavin transporter, member 3-A-like isoform X2 [Ischnura elegans]|uniref:solute carrier family 52, riboflavin transporter, member 3-A-like isoform X2 n=1 Tax=Ischnura elegans TaxID=197161 RepID=UPI001ED874ED|nr:solute carrier family 52, riboflavin transporter, member 3-A-like isoform X2 [Ischnura elegans]
MDMKSFSPSCKDRSILVDVLSLVFGLGAWVSVTGFWVELPILIENLPEGWRVSSQLSVAIQSANIGPFLWAALPLLKRGQHAGGFSIKTRQYFTYALLLMGVIANILLAFKWDSSVMIGGNLHSVPLIILMFAVGLIGCTSPVLFMPQMALFPQVHLISYLVGEGLGGFVPSIIALIQGIKNGDSQPRFSAMVYFLIISSLMLLSTISFFLLNNLTAAKKVMINSNVTNSEVVKNTDINHVGGIEDPTSLEPRRVECIESSPERGDMIPSQIKEKNEVDLIIPESNNAQLKKKAIKILLIQGWICFFSSGFLPGVSTYASLPHGNEAFHLSSTLGAAVVPIGTSIAFLNKQHPKLTLVGAVAAIASILSVYTILSAAYSPNPPLVGTEIGCDPGIVRWFECICKSEFSPDMSAY